MLPDFLDKTADYVARHLLGQEIVRTFDDGQTARVRIVETESYDQDDAASHSYRGETPRTRVMFGESGYAYVYFTYGMHYCLNVVCGPTGRGEAVLIRAVEPLENEQELTKRRGVQGINVTNGPAKLCRALGITTSMTAHDLSSEPLRLVAAAAVADSEVTQTTRIGITRARDELRRWYITGNPYVSKP